MSISRRRFAALSGAATLLASGAAFGQPRQSRILVFHKATGYTHPSIQTGIEMMRGIAARENLEIEVTDDPEIFSPDNLARFDGITLLCCTTDSQHAESEWLVGPRRDALQAFVHRGGAIVGIHAAADSHHHWPWYGQMIGGYFDRHPASPNVRPGRLLVVDRDDPSTRGLPAVIERADEWYLFRDFNPLVHMLIVAEVGSVYDVGSDPVSAQWYTSQTNTPTRYRLPEANPKPVSWRHEFEGARVFYTSMGHVPDSFTEPLVVQHITGGLRWALGRERARG